MEMIDSGTTERPDDIRSSVFDVSVKIAGEIWELAPDHDFDPLINGEAEVDVRDASRGNARKKRNLRKSAVRAPPALHRHRSQADQEVNELYDPNKNEMYISSSVMVTYAQTATYRSLMEDGIDDPNSILQRPLETPEYRAKYVSYLQSMDFSDFENLEFVSAFMYSEFPTTSPTPLTPPSETAEVSDVVTPDKPTWNPTKFGTKDF